MAKNPTIETISKRKSTRTFDASRSIEREKIDHLREYIESLATEKMRVVLIEKDLAGIKLGTYGSIAGANAYLVGIAADRAKETVIALGTLFEKVILEATSLGLSTCWLGISYSKKDFGNYLTIAEGEKISMVSPLGYPAEKERLRDTLVKFAMKSHKRKPWEKIFFNNNWETPLTPEKSGKMREILEMVRIAPSSSNKQPWRLLKESNCLHLYIYTPSAMIFQGFNSGHNDLGIAKCHINLTAESLGVQGEWQYGEPVSLKKEKMEYVGSWKML